MLVFPRFGFNVLTACIAFPAWPGRFDHTESGAGAEDSLVVR
jgi:hypothetical protein